jgi:hypothetical protein
MSLPDFIFHPTEFGSLTLPARLASNPIATILGMIANSQQAFRIHRTGVAAQ